MKLNLGCGPTWKEDYPEYEGLDIHNYGQKYVGDALSMLTKSNIEVYNIFKGTIYDEIMANHFLEHFSQDEVRSILKGIYLLLKPGGLFRFVVPHMKKERAWVLSHKTFWNEYTVRWLEREDANTVYGFGRWAVDSLVTNERDDIHATLKKL